MAVREEPVWCGAAERVRVRGPVDRRGGPSHGRWFLSSVHTPRKGTTTPGYMACGAAGRPHLAGDGHAKPGRATLVGGVGLNGGRGSRPGVRVRALLPADPRVVP